MCALKDDKAVFDGVLFIVLEDFCQILLELDRSHRQKRSEHERNSADAIAKKYIYVLDEKNMLKRRQRFLQPVRSITLSIESCVVV